MSRKPFRVRLEWEDGDYGDFDVTAVHIEAYADQPLQVTTEYGLTILAPENKEETDDARP